MNAEAIKEFTDRLSRGELPAPKPGLLDPLLHWLAGRDTDSARAIQNGFDAAKVSRDQAWRSTLLYLDSTLFSREDDSYRLFSLTPDCKLADIRARHKWLLQVFHPDRHHRDQDWFTSRAERINHAFADLKENHGRPVSRSRPIYSPASPGRTRAGPVPGVHARARPRSAPSSTREKDKLRRRLHHYLGSSASAQRRLFIVLSVLPVLLLAVLYLNNQGDVPTILAGNPTKDANTPTAVAEPDTVPSQTGAQLAQSNPKPVVENLLKDDAPDEGLSPETEPGSRFPAASAANLDNRFAETLNRPMDEEPARETATVADTRQASADNEHVPTVAYTEESSEADQDKTLNRTETDTKIADTTESESVAAQDATEQAQISREPEPGPEDEPPSEKSGQAEPDTTIQKPVPDAQPAGESEQIAAAPESAPENTSDITEPDQRANESEAGEQNAPESQPAVPEPDTNEQSAPETREASSATAAQTSADNDINAISLLLKQYQEAYTSSDIKRFGELFQKDAKTKHATGRQEIVSKYQEFFRKTAERKVDFNKVSIELLGGRQFIVNTEYTATWTYQGGRNKSNSGEFTFHLIPAGPDLKIWRLNY